MFKNNQQMHKFLSIYYFHFAAPTCFGINMPSSGNVSVHAELHAKLGLWLIKFCVVCGCVYTMWWPGVYRSVRCVYCVVTWCVPICPVCILCGDLVCTDLSGVYTMWWPGVYRSVRCVYYVVTWCVPICPVCILCGDPCGQTDRRTDGHDEADSRFS
jgi:hypothetical protein